MSCCCVLIVLGLVWWCVLSGWWLVSWVGLCVVGGWLAMVLVLFGYLYVWRMFAWLI